MKMKRLRFFSLILLLVMLFIGCGQKQEPKWEPVRKMSQTEPSIRISESAASSNTSSETAAAAEQTTETPPTDEATAPSQKDEYSAESQEPSTAPATEPADSTSHTEETAAPEDTPERGLPTSSDPTEPETAAGETQISYVANKNTKKFHYPTCSSVADMKESNKLNFTGTRDELIAQGYQPCRRCNP